MEPCQVGIIGFAHWSDYFVIVLLTGKVYNYLLCWLVKWNFIRVADWKRWILISVAQGVK